VVDEKPGRDHFGLPASGNIPVAVVFELHFLPKKADPQSKGKVENVIQYIKKNFLFNRLYQDNETLNEEAIAWLHRTANHLPHNYTKIAPQVAFA
jgi:hypothetical protein